ncbi:MAG TPA: glycoside hydrolase family 3 C-terminal domain-containing protein [Pengzhenrongella sp.]
MPDDDVQLTDSARPAYADTTQPMLERARDLLARLTLGEKIALLHQHAPAVERLGLAAFHTGAEALHGVAWLGDATTFPQPVGLAATWDPDLLARIGAVVGTELRAKHAADPSVSLNVWAPVVNPLRHPRWGRNEEGYSEDPHLTAELAGAYARGLRGDHPVYWRTVPTLKHFLAYNNEDDRCVTSSQLRPRVLHEYELPAYRGPIEAGVVGAVMPSYNLVNGRPNHVARELLDELRSWTDASLLVVSDAAAPSNLVTFERYFPDHVESHAAMVRAGVDSFTDNGPDATPVIAHLTTALDRGLLTESEIDRSVLRQLMLRLATGELDPDLDPYAGTGADEIDLPAHRELAREAVARSVVVLANDGILPLAPAATIAVVGPLAERVLTDWYSGTPPYLVGIAEALTERLGAGSVRVADGADRVALRSLTTGRYVRQVDAATPLLADGSTAGTDAQFDVAQWGEGLVTLRAVGTGLLWSGAGGLVRADSTRVAGWVAQESFRTHTHEDGTWSVQHVGSGKWLRVQRDAAGTLVAEAPDASSAERFAVRTVRAGHAEVAAAAAWADVVVVAVGNDPHLLGRETEDRPHLRLPDAFHEIWNTAREANPRAVLAVVSSYPYVLGEVADDAAAVVWSSHGGQELGHGLVDVLTGDLEPTGRLAQSWVADEAHIGDLFDYDVIAAGSTYWYARHDPLYAFGHGLSYSRVEYSAIELSSPTLDADDPSGPVVEARVHVTNVGSRPVAELVQLYVTADDHRLQVPGRRLVGHARVDLEPGASAVVTLPVRAADLSIWDVTRDRFVTEPGRYGVLAGRSSADLPLRGDLEVHGEAVPPRAALGRALRAVDFDDAGAIEIAERTREEGDAVQVAARATSGWVVLRDVDASGARAGTLALARTRGGNAHVRVEVAGAPGTWLTAATADAPSTGGRHTWSDVTLEPGPAWERLGTGVVDVRLVLSGAVRVGELRLT